MADFTMPSLGADMDQGTLLEWLVARRGTPDARGGGVGIKKYKDGGLPDVTTFVAKEGLTWRDSAGREFSATMKEVSEWRGNRADAGRLPPKGFPKSNKFGRGIE